MALLQKTLFGLSWFTEPLSAPFPWHMLSAVAAAWHRQQNIPHLPIQSCTPLFPSLSFSQAHLTDPAEGLTCYERGCSTALAGNGPFPVPGRGCAALMCHAICKDWLMVALSSTRFCQHEQAPAGNALDYVPVFPLSLEWPWGYYAKIAGAALEYAN